MSIPPAFLDELRARTDLPALIGRSVKLTRAGREHRGCCPFHNEKSPSFYVYADHYHCFGCGAHGDAIRWLTDKSGLPFPEAVKELAAQAGLEVPQPTPEARARAERAATLGDAVAAAAQWFEERLWSAEGAAARDYLARRGVTPETARTFGLGLAPPNRTGLAKALARFGDALLIEAGLLIAPEDPGSGSGAGGTAPFDRFRGRLMFPIRDARGRPVGFGGRALGDVKPKYLNSPDTPLFDKGRLLFNLDRAAGPARAAQRLILVEGYMDAIALHQAGIAEVVAPLGTALTEAQLVLAWKQVSEPILCFDGDAAGLAAAGKAARRALPGLAPGRSVRIATLPQGKDPDDLVRDGGAPAFEGVAAAAAPLHTTLWQAALAAADTATPEGRAGLKADLAALAATITDAEVRRQYEAQFRDMFWTSFGWRKGAPPPAPARGGSALRAAARPRDREALALFAGLLDHPDIAADHLESLSAMHIADGRLRRLRDALVESLGTHPHLDSARLGNTLASQGFGDLVVWVRASTARATGKSRETGDPEVVRGRIAAMVEAFAAVEANASARASIADGLRSALKEGGETADALFETQRALILRRTALHETVYEQMQVPGSGPGASDNHNLDIRVNGQHGESDSSDGREHGNDEQERG